MEIFCKKTKKKNILKTEGEVLICPSCLNSSNRLDFKDNHPAFKEYEYTVEDIDKIVDQICEPYGNHISVVLDAAEVLKNFLANLPVKKVPKKATPKDTEKEAMDYYSQKFQMKRLNRDA